jgi:hypothetical protein
MQSTMNTVSDMVPSTERIRLSPLFPEDRGDGAEKSGGFHQEFVKEVSFRKGIAFYIFLIKRAGFAQSLFPTIYVCG